MATLRTGPFLVPALAPNGNPVNTVVVSLTNQTTRTLQVVLKINEVTLNPQPLPPGPRDIKLLLAPQRISIRSGEAKSFSVAVSPEQSTTAPAAAIAPATPGSTALIVTVRGDVAKSARKVMVGVTGGFADPADPTVALTDSEPTMFLSHDDFVLVRR